MNTERAVEVAFSHPTLSLVEKSLHYRFNYELRSLLLAFGEYYELVIIIEAPLHFTSTSAVRSPEDS